MVDTLCGWEYCCCITAVEGTFAATSLLLIATLLLILNACCAAACTAYTAMVSNNLQGSTAATQCGAVYVDTRDKACVELRRLCVALYFVKHNALQNHRQSSGKNHVAPNPTHGTPPKLTTPVAHTCGTTLYLTVAANSCAPEALLSISKAQPCQFWSAYCSAIDTVHI